MLLPEWIGHAAERAIGAPAGLPPCAERLFAAASV